MGFFGDFLGGLFGGLVGMFMPGVGEDAADQIANTGNQMTVTANAVMDKSQQLLNQGIAALNQLLNQGIVAANQVTDRNQQILNQAIVAANQLLNRGIAATNQMSAQANQVSASINRATEELREWRNIIQSSVSMFVVIFFAITIIFAFYKIINCCFSNSRNKPIVDTLDDKVMAKKNTVTDFYRRRTKDERRYERNEENNIRRLEDKWRSYNPDPDALICRRTVWTNTARLAIPISMLIFCSGLILSELSEEIPNKKTFLYLSLAAISASAGGIFYYYCKHSLQAGIAKSKEIANSKEVTEIETTIELENFDDNLSISVESAVNTIRKLNEKKELGVEVVALLKTHSIFKKLSGGPIKIADALEGGVDEGKYNENTRVQVDICPIVLPSPNLPN